MNADSVTVISGPPPPDVPRSELEAGADPRFKELGPCIICKSNNLVCDGFPCTACDERFIECTPAKDAWAAALYTVTHYVEAKLIDLNKRQSRMSADELSQELQVTCKDRRFRYSFRLTEDNQVQLVCYTRRCYWCHPNRLPCVYSPLTSRCEACDRGNLSCRRFAITFHTDSHDGQALEDKFRKVWRELLAATRHSQCA